ncbi:MAG: YCF48-related protein, partial [Bacteroidota bacterium]
MKNRIASVFVSGRHGGIVLFVTVLLCSISLQAQTWTWKNPLPHSVTNNSIQRPQDNHIIIVGDQGRIIRSTDDGKTWELTQSNTTISFHDQSFIDADYGWACGEDGIISHTSDGGRNWQRQTTGTSKRIYAVNFFSREVGWACGVGGLILYTSDGGQTWLDKSYEEPFFLRSIYFDDDRRGWA